MVTNSSNSNSFPPQVVVCRSTNFSLGVALSDANKFEWNVKNNSSKNASWTMTRFVTSYDAGMRGWDGRRWKRRRAGSHIKGAEMKNKLKNFV